MLIKEEQSKSNKSAEEIAKDLVEKAESNANMSRNHYRINAMKGLSGGRRAAPQGGRAAAQSKVNLVFTFARFQMFASRYFALFLHHRSTRK